MIFLYFNDFTRLTHWFYILFVTNVVKAFSKCKSCEPIKLSCLNHQSQRALHLLMLY